MTDSSSRDLYRQTLGNVGGGRVIVPTFEFIPSIVESREIWLGWEFGDTKDGGQFCHMFLGPIVQSAE